MQLSPPNDRRPTSVWQRRGQAELVRAHPDELEGVSPIRTTETLTEPPWIRSGALGEPAGDTRPAPPQVGVPQQCTTVQIVGGSGEYRVVIDGVQAGELDLYSGGDAPRYWLPRFRDVRSLTPAAPSGLVWREVDELPADGEPIENAALGAALAVRRVFSAPEWRAFGVSELRDEHYAVSTTGAWFVPDDSRRLAAPLCIAMRVEEGKASPLRAAVHVRQRVWDHGTLVMDRRVQSETLVPHSDGGYEAPYVLLPYPAAVCTPPHVHIIDADALRRWELTRRRWKRGRLFDILRNVYSLINSGASGQANAVWGAVQGLASGRNWQRTLSTSRCRWPSRCGSGSR
jgi:hypothetical protein